MTRHEWHARLQLTGDPETDRANREAMLDAVAESMNRWRCSRCGSPRWVAASVTGPVSHGGRAIKQCIPCGRYSSDPVEP